MNKPTNFNDLLELQRVLDENIEKSRSNGFVPRKRSLLDILLAIDDEFQEWLKELPYELNFKTWKQKEYSREKELEELTDVLFFFLQYCRAAKKYDYKFIFQNFENWEMHNYTFLKEKGFEYWIAEFKYDLWSENIEFSFSEYLKLVYFRGFTKEDLLNTYWKKWQKNMTRINKDWILEGK